MTMSREMLESSTRAPEADGPQLTVAEHLQELRRRLAICVGAIVVGTCVGMGLAERLLAWLKAPAGSLLPRLAFFSPTEALVAYVKVAAALGS